MHINAKRMKRRIEKAQEAHIYGSPNLTDDLRAIVDPTERPEYLKATTPGDRAKILGLHITEAPDEETGGTVYILAGGCLNDLGEPARELETPAALAAEINLLWDIMTEPTAEYYTDDAGRLHQRIEYPAISY